MSDEQEKGFANVEIEVTCGGRRYVMNAGDFSATDEMRFKEVTGSDLMSPFISGQVNSITISGLIWLYRVRQGEKKLTFRAVADVFRWSDLDNIEIRDKSEEKDDDASEVDFFGALPPES
jgi:hypothetical protein